MLPVHIVNRLQEKLVGRRGVDTVALEEDLAVPVEAVKALSGGVRLPQKFGASTAGVVQLAVSRDTLGLNEIR